MLVPRDYTAPDKNHAVLITIDTQRDFTLPGAPAEIPGTLEVVPQVRRMLEAGRRHHFPIIHVIRLYLPDGSNVDACRRHLIETGERIVLPDSPGAELVDDLKPNKQIKLDSARLLAGELQSIGDNEWIMYKPRWGAFYRTPLEKHLRSVEANTLIVTGCNYPNCPRTTIYEASERDFRVVMVTDAVSGVYNRALLELENIGVHLMSTSQCIEWLSSPETAA